jgi:hypothetical protein
MNCETEELGQKISRELRQKTELSPNSITFHSWETMRKLQGVGKELKEQKLIDNRPST